MNCSHATLGKNIRTLRNARGLSQEALAQDAQITQSHLGCIERGRGNPTVETLFSICNALQVDIAELFPEKHRKCSTAQIQLKILRFVGFGYIA